MDGLVIQLVIMAVFGIVCSMVASNRGRSALGWFFIGAMFGCIGLIILLVIPNLKVEQERQERLRRQNRRLREKLRKDRQVADQRHGAVKQRLGIHDEALGVDTSRAVAGAPQPAHLGEGDEAPPAPPAAASRRWYYLVGEDRKGPLSDAEFRALWRKGVLGPDTLVWIKKLPDWKAIRDIPGLEAKLDA
ncbi:MAG: DUF4339 domain-containing protein [Planctomycetota bacterium]